MLHAVIIAAALLAAPSWLALVWALDYRATGREQVDDGAETRPEQMPLAA